MTSAESRHDNGQRDFFPACRNYNAYSHRWLARWAAIAASLLVILGSGQRSVANVIYVTTLQDGVGTGSCSLKEAIYSSTLHDTLDGVHGIAIDYTDPDHFITTGCELGSGNDTIILPTGYPLPTVQLTTDTSWDAHNPYGPTATPIINSNITIQGYGTTLQWAGTGNARLFAIGPATITTPNGVSTGTGSLTLINVQIMGFSAKGGNGAYGGGGGLGAGGAIYVQSGKLLVENSTFDGNTASGGNGGDTNVGSGGGGGGLGGNGGGAPGLESGGGGGGSRGNGGNAADGGAGGGGGGGTVYNGASSIQLSPAGGPGGYLCGGDAGADSNNGNNGDNGKCPGGGGGGAGYDSFPSNPLEVVSGGNGAYGGGGGGGPDQGGHGGFGGGGGGPSNYLGYGGGLPVGQGGNGGFGGGGGIGYEDPLTGNGGPGQGGAFGGNGTNGGAGGGGAALGGAIFSDSATVVIENSTFANNSLIDGQGGPSFGGNIGDNGGAAGTIFARDGSLAIIDSTISGNQADGTGAGVVVYSDSSASFTLNDTIIANNGTDECYVAGSVTVAGAGNLIMSNGSGGSFNPCPGVVATGDPQLGPLQLNAPGITPTMAISTTSTAFNAADAATSLSTDQRGVDRPQDGGYDIGAYEACAPPRVYGEITCVTLVNAPPEVFDALTMQILPAGVGSTSPPLGVNQEPAGSVVALSATVPNPQYSFLGWTVNVTDPVSASTTILMNQAQTVTANFALCNCVINASGYFSVMPGPMVLNPITKRYAETVTVSNTSSFTFFGPISLVLGNLSSNATLSNASGPTTVFAAGSPYVSTSGNVAPGQSVSFALQFTDPTNAVIFYDALVLTGPGSR